MGGGAGEGGAKDVEGKYVKKTKAKNTYDITYEKCGNDCLRSLI